METKSRKKWRSGIRISKISKLLSVLFIMGLLMINSCNGGSESSEGSTTPNTGINPPPASNDDDDDEVDVDSATPVYTWDPSAFSHVYDVGPGKQYAEPGDVPWEALAPSTLVRIYYRSTPYQAKWVINVAATALSPVVVLGIPEGGQRPVITGNGAVTRTELDYRNEVRSIIKIGGSSIPDNPDGPSYIYIQGLDIRGARPGYHFTDDAGSTQEYSSNAAAIHIEEGSDITIHDCLIHDGGDTDMYRRGTLYFYHNTVVSTRSGNTTLMRLSTVDVTAQVFNNIIYASAGGGYLAITSGNGQTELEDNWLPAGWKLTHESGLDPGATVADLGNTEGSTPGFIDFNAQDFHLALGSQARGNAGSLPADVAGYPVDYQYVRHQQIEERPPASLADIGAFGF